MRKIVLLFMLAGFSLSNLTGAEPGLRLPPAPKLQFEFLQENDRIPQEYKKDELPSWLQSLRRGEVIFFGSLPFTVLFSSLGYRTGKYAVNYFTRKEGESVPGWNEVNRSDQIWMIGISLGLSLSIAITDYIIGKIQAGKS